MLLVNGKEQSPAAEAGPGEIIAIAKLKNTGIGDTLATKASEAQFAPMVYPTPTMHSAVYAVKSGEDEKIAAGLIRISEEDPTVRFERDPETSESVLSCMGDQHLNNVISRLKSMFKVDVELRTPKVPYRETIQGTGKATYRHKKQTGGHGQLATVSSLKSTCASNSCRMWTSSSTMKSSAGISRRTTFRPSKRASSKPWSKGRLPAAR
jgi:elongation factor G